MRHSSEVAEGSDIIENIRQVPSISKATLNQIKQVCWNLARNALQAMPKGGTLTIRVIIHRTPSHRSEDNGQG